MFPAENAPGSEFATTQWSIVLQAACGLDGPGSAALASLCQRYWYPLYAYVRRRVVDVERAKDLTQEFFSRLLETNLIQKANPGRGQFRCFLLTSLQHFLANEADKQRAAKRGGGRPLLSLDFESGENRLSLEPYHELTPERLFERQWALSLLDLIVERLRAEYAATNKSAHFELLQRAVAGEDVRLPFAVIAEELGMTEENARQAGHRLRKRFRQLLRDEVAQTIDESSSIDEEIGRLFQALEE